MAKTHRMRQTLIQYKKWRIEHGIYFCVDCGQDLLSSPHHIRCHKCWRKHQATKSVSEISPSLHGKESFRKHLHKHGLDDYIIKQGEIPQ